jgi:hypothetical protein
MNYDLIVVTAGDNIAAPIVVNVVGCVLVAWDIARAYDGP